MASISFYPLSWQEFHNDVFSLAQQILSKELKFDRLVCIERGGAVVTRFLSDFLKLPTSGFVMVSYKEFNQTSQPKIKEELAADIKGEKILLVDEIVDSGSTFRMALEYLETLKPQKIMTLAPYIKPTTKLKPDFWQVKTDRWVIFPYEVRETIQDLKEMLQKQGWSEEKIKQKLIKLNLKEAWVKDFFD